MANFSAADWCFFDGSVQPIAYYSALRDFGFTSVEMVPPDRYAFARDSGLKILNQSGPSITDSFSNAKSSEAVVQSYVDACESCHSAGIPDLIVFSGNRIDDRGFARCVEGFGEVLRRTAHVPVRLLFEMFCEKNHAGYDGMGSQYGFSLVRELQNPRFLALYDVYHMVQEGEDPIRDITKNDSLIGHLHFAQPPHRTAPLIDGSIDWRTIVQLSEGRWTCGLEFMPQGERLGAARDSLHLLNSFE